MTVESILVTIVVPVYKVEKYLDNCIESLVDQTYPNLEIILVDDCSPDGCPEICDAWAERDKRIRVIHKEENEGLGMARNTGMDVATGDYICFFDSDDYVLRETVERLVLAVQRERFELALFGFQMVNDQGTVISRFEPPMGEKSFFGTKVQEYVLPNMIAQDPRGNGLRLFYMSAWSIMYSIKVIRRLNWRFVSEREIIAEDVYSLLDLFGDISSVTVVPEALYCYRCNDQSLSRSYRRERYGKIRYFYLEALELCRRKNYSEDIRHRVSKPYLAFTLAALKQEAKAPLSMVERRRNVYCILRDPVLIQVLRQNRGDWATKPRKLMFFLIENKLFGLSFLLFMLKR